jgi:hypothetical protein
MATGGFLVFVLAEGQQPPSIRVGHKDRTRLMPYASMTLSGSRMKKRTHLKIGEPNSCPGSGRSFLQSHSPHARNSSSHSPLLCVVQYLAAGRLFYARLGV